MIFNQIKVKYFIVAGEIIFVAALIIATIMFGLGLKNKNYDKKPNVDQNFLNIMEEARKENDNHTKNYSGSGEEIADQNFVDITKQTEGLKDNQSKEDAKQSAESIVDQNFLDAIKK